MPKRHYEGHTIESVSRLALEGQKFTLLVGDFLDDFRYAEAGQRASMISRPPLDLPEMERVPFLAAMAHKLANDHGLAPPGGVFERRCYLPDDSPHIGPAILGRLSKLYLYQSPPEFKHRGLFVGKSVLARA